jgi:MoxR-like ATPase
MFLEKQAPREMRSEHQEYLIRRLSPHPDDPTNSEVSIRWLVQSLVRGAIDGLKRNKLAAILAAVTAVVLIMLAASSQFDGLSDYQQSILPRLLRLEAGFLSSLRSAENTTGEWRGYYFENAHRQVRDILRVARLDRPQGYVARQKHAEFIRYYDMLDSAFSDIGMQLRTKPDLDYVLKLKKRMDQLTPVRNRWATWGEPQKSTN